MSERLLKITLWYTTNSFKRTEQSWNPSMYFARKILQKNKYILFVKHHRCRPELFSFSLGLYNFGVKSFCRWCPYIFQLLTPLNSTVVSTIRAERLILVIKFLSDPMLCLTIKTNEDLRAWCFSFVDKWYLVSRYGRKILQKNKYILFVKYHRCRLEMFSFPLGSMQFWCENLLPLVSVHLFKYWHLSTVWRSNYQSQKVDSSNKLFVRTHVMLNDQNK